MVEVDSTHRSKSGSTALEHMEEEFRALEEPRRPWGLWVGGAILVAAAGAAYYFLADRSPRPTRALAATGAIIEISAPRGGRLAQAPPGFAWESISGRHDYRFVLTAEGQATPLVDRAVRNTSIELKPEELALLTSGRSYAWTVTARQADRRVFATGQGRFQLR